MPDPEPQRARLIRRMLRHGMSIEMATAAVDADRVMLTLLQHLIGGSRTFSREQAAARAGLDLSVAETIDRASGLAEDAAYSESDIHHLSLLSRLLQVLPTDVVVAQVRAEIPSMRALALRTLDTLDTAVLHGLDTDDDDPIQTAVDLAGITRPLLDLTSELVGASFRRVVLSLITSDLVAASLRTGEETLEVAVAFVDVVGYTSLAGRIDPAGLGVVLSTFEQACQQVVEEHPTVSLVKFLGDACMFVALDPDALASALLDLVIEHEEDGGDEGGDEDGVEAIPVSAGMAFGPALLRGGDYFGPAVNEAARLTDLARQHTILVSEPLAEVLAPNFSLRRLKSVALHGIGRRRPHALRGRLDPPGGG